MSPSTRGRILRALPALGWTAMIGWFSSGQWSAEATQPRLAPLLAALLPWLSPESVDAVHVLIRKGGHAAEYGALAALWAFAIAGWRGPLALSVLTAFLDELHQATTLARQGNFADVLLDTAGAAAALAFARTGPGSVLAVLTGGFLWIAAVGGMVLLAVNLATGAGSGWLWLSVPAAWCALIIRARQTRRPRPDRTGAPVSSNVGGRGADIAER